MTKATIRKATKEDFHALAEVVRDAWTIDKFIQNDISHIYAYQYTIDCYSHCTFCYVAEYENEIVGFMMGRVGKDFIQNEEILSELKQLQSNLNNYPNAARCMQTLKDYYIVGYSKMKEQQLDSTNELVLFAVKEEYQRKGIGKELMFKSLYHMKENGLNECFLLTDSGCTYQMYDKYQFKRQLATPFDFITPTVVLPIQLFVYTYDLTQLQ